MPPNLKIIPKLGVGLDMIDIPAATDAGVMNRNPPGVNDVAVPEHTRVAAGSFAPDDPV